MDTLRGKTTIRELLVMASHLPPGNAVQRELHGPWADSDWMLHDISSQLRQIASSYYNVHREKGAPPVHAEHLPSPGSDKAPEDDRSPERIKAEQDHLQAVLSRHSPA